jgi:hypothetical protein
MHADLTDPLESHTHGYGWAGADTDRSTQRVLCLDSRHEAIRLAAALLSSWGYFVGLSVEEIAPDSIALLVCTAETLLEADLGQVHAALKGPILALGKDLAEVGRLPDNAHFLRMPFAAEELAQAVQDALYG